MLISLRISAQFSLEDCGFETIVTDDGNAISNLQLNNVASMNENCDDKIIEWDIKIRTPNNADYQYEFASSLPIDDDEWDDTNGNSIPDQYIAPTHAGERISVTIDDELFSSIYPYTIQWEAMNACGDIEKCNSQFEIQDGPRQGLLLKCIPNPFLTNARLEFYLSEESEVQLIFRDQLGRTILEKKEFERFEKFPVGLNYISLDQSYEMLFFLDYKVTKGVFFCAMITNNLT